MTVLRWAIIVVSLAFLCAMAHYELTTPISQRVIDWNSR